MSDGDMMGNGHDVGVGQDMTQDFGQELTEIDNRSSSHINSNGTTPVMSSTPQRRTPTLSNAKFQRPSSQCSQQDKATVAFRNLLQGKLLITQAEPHAHDDEEEDAFDFRNDGRMTSDTDYETDLEMDYDQWIAEENNEIQEDSTLEKKYIHMCNETGTVPASYFIRHIKNAKFRMRHHGLGPLGAKAIATPLKENHDIELLDLEGNWIEKQGAIHIADMLRENIYITDVNVAENRLGREGADAICEMLFKNEYLKSLNMSGNQLQDYGACQISEMLEKNSCLKHLYLSHNQFEEKAAFAFKVALSHNETLETLDLSWNHFRTNGAVAVAEGIQENYGLKSLNVAMNGFSDIGAEALGRALKHNRGLTELDVSHNRITEEGAGHISLGLQTNDTLAILRLGWNPLGTDGPMALIVAMSKNDTCAMTCLDISDVFVTKEFRNMQNKLELEREVEFIHAGVLMDKELDMVEQEALETFRRNPYEKLRNYIRAAGYRLMDLFKDFDKDGSMSITREEFEQGLLNAGVEITETETNILMKKLDINGDGLIDYSELVVGDKEYRKEMREKEQCPEDRKLQRDQNRLRKERSQFMDDVINS